MQVALELEKGGMGARKRRRGVGAKQNIAEAKWMVVDGAGVERSVDGREGNAMGGVSPMKGAGVLKDEDAFVVPRKRTNANHMITPRKPLRSIENSVVAPVLEVGQNLSPMKEVKSPAKSPAKGVKVALNDLDRQGTENADKEMVKPRRRKSMRKSRRLTTSDLVEETTEERRGSFVFGKVGGDAEVETFSGVVAPLEQAGGQSEVTSANVEQWAEAEAVSPVLEEATVTLPVEKTSESQETVSAEQEADAEENIAPEVTLSEQDEELQHEAPDQAEEQDNVADIVESRDDVASKTERSLSAVNAELDRLFGIVPVVDVSTTESPQLEIIGEQAVEAAAESTDIQRVTFEPSELDAISEQPLQTPLKTSQLQSAVLQPTESNMATIISPAKSVGTPRSRRKTPQRSATRRSTRTSRSSRASSLPREEISVQAATVVEVTTSETVNVALYIDSHAIDSVSQDSDVKAASEVEQDEIVEKANNMAIEQTSSYDEQLTDSNTLDEILDTTKVVEASVDEKPEPDSIPTEDNEHEMSAVKVPERHDEVERGSTEQESCDEQLRLEVEIFTPKRKGFKAKSHSPIIQSLQDVPSSEDISEEAAETFELIEPESITTSEYAPCSPPDEASEELHESSTPDPSTTELTETICENAPVAVYDHDDTDMLRNFLSKVKANKAAKAKTSIPKRKRSLPHSPLQIPLEAVDAPSSPGSPKDKDEFDVNLPEASPSKRRKRSEPIQEAIPQEGDVTEPRSIRRSGRTRLPVKAAPAAPSFIPVRRLGQDGDSTVTLRRNEEKELAALTKVNTRKNKGGAAHPADVLAKKADEKEDPAVRQRALKEVFDEKSYKQKLNKKGNTVVWAEELAQFQTEEGKKIVLASLPEKDGKKEGKKVSVAEKEPEREKKKPILPGDERKSVSVSASSTPKVKVGMRSKMTLGMAANGTPAPKRRMRGRS